MGESIQILRLSLNLQVVGVLSGPEKISALTMMKRL
jgi:hypothetical protein